MRRSLAPLLLVAACLLAPAALSAEAIQGKSPTNRPLVLPQLYCAIVYDASGEQRCDVAGPLSRANELRVVIAGGAGNVRVLVDDKSAPITKQLAYVDCSRSCVERFPEASATSALMYVYSTGALGHSVAVSIHTDANGAIGS